MVLIAPLRALVTSDGPRKWQSVTLPAGTVVQYLTSYLTPLGLYCVAISVPTDSTRDVLEVVPAGLVPAVDGEALRAAVGEAGYGELVAVARAAGVIR